MPAKPLRIFVASPGDTAIERESLPGVVNEINRTLRALHPTLEQNVELVRWESHSYPAMGRPQGVINDQIGQYDIFIGILWKRFGTPTGRAESGTEEEFRVALTNWQKDGSPHILFYFSRQQFAPPKSSVEMEQLSKVVSFRQQLESDGLVWEYESAAQFSSVVRPHLTEVIGKLLNAGTPVADSSRSVTGPEATSRPTEQQLPIGLRVRIADIGPDDAFTVEDRARVLGRTGVVVEVMRNEDWYSGSVRLDKPVIGMELLYFFQFRYELAPIAA